MASMKSKFGSFKSTRGTAYSIKRASSASSKKITCVVHLLEEKTREWTLDRNDQGSRIFDMVVQYMDLVEKDYFGLAIRNYPFATDKKKKDKDKQGVTSPEVTVDGQDFPPFVWLDPVKKLKKQCPGSNTLELDFRVRFCVASPHDLQEEYTKYLLFLQCRKDVVSGRLKCSLEAAQTLGSHTLQSEFGDYDPGEHPEGYASSLSLYCFQSPEFERRTEELHKQLSGITPDMAELMFLDRACKLDFYGVNLFPGKDQQGIPLRLTATALGVAVFDNDRKINTYLWSNIEKITFRRRRLFIELKDHGRADTTAVYTLCSMEACQLLWENSIDHHIFFKRERAEKKQKGGLIRKGSKHNFPQRTRKQALLEDHHRLRTRRSSGPKDYFERVKLAQPLRPYTEPRIVRAVSSPSNGLVSMAVRDDSFIQLPGLLATPSSHLSVKRTQTMPSRSRDSSPVIVPRPDTMRKPEESKYFRFPSPIHPNGGSSDYSGPDEYYDPRLAAMEDALDQYGYSADELAAEGLLPVRLVALDGKYGFNVTGGADHKLPIVINKVLPDSAASLATPSVATGDQILYINGHPVSEIPRSEVIELIKQSVQSERKEMLLIVKPSDLSRLEAPTMMSEVNDTIDSPGEAVQQSLLAIRRGLKSGRLLRQFDQLYRRLPNVDIVACKLPHNVPKNRYKDVFAYDVTRVRLREGPDYINANYINMEIPKTGLLLRYIAAQGPLRHTCSDFWQMVWEQESTLIIMLTTTTEGGKSKCARYWPYLQKTVNYGPFEVYCLSEEEVTAHSATCRHFVLRHHTQRLERRILHLQYTAWPDHGAPDRTDDFMNFMLQVRKERRDLDEPVIVHCSAGVGRTGVLIAVEMAMNMIEALEPIDLMEITRKMRNQRGMMIQSPAQFRFVAECILQAYTEGFCEFDT